jgi:hypothetical protein
MKITVATGSVKSFAPIATLTRPAWQRLNIATGAVMTSTRCYGDICVKIWCLLLAFTKRDCQQNLLHQILLPHTIVCQQECIVSERWIGWSRKLLDIFDQVIRLWVYKMVDGKYSWWGGTKVWVRLNWSSVATGTVSQLPIATECHTSNELGEVISARCYCDWARLAVSERSNGHGDAIGPLLLWPSSTSHRKIYDTNCKVS